MACAIKLGPLHRLPLTYPTLEHHRFKTTLDTWQRAPVLQHGFLFFFYPGDLEKGVAYTSDSYGFTLLTEAALWAAQVGLGVPVAISQQMLPLLWQCFLLGMFLFLLPPKRELSHQVLAFLAVGILVTQPAFWILISMFPPDNPHPYGTLGFTALAVLYRKKMLSGRAALIVLAGIAMVIPVYGLLAALVLVLFAEKQIEWRSRPATALASLAAFSLLMVALPKWVAAWVHLKQANSSFFFRTGLDGDTTFFTNIFQAMFRPHPPSEQMWEVWHLPAVTGLFILWVALTLKNESKYRAMIGQFFLVTCPYLFFAVVFPQCLSTHTYVFSSHLTVGCSFLLATWSVEEDIAAHLKGPWLLAWGFVVGALVLNNLNELARANRIFTSIL